MLYGPCPHWTSCPACCLCLPQAWSFYLEEDCPFSLLLGNTSSSFRSIPSLPGRLLPQGWWAEGESICQLAQGSWCLCPTGRERSCEHQGQLHWGHCQRRGGKELEVLLAAPHDLACKGHPNLFDSTQNCPGSPVSASSIRGLQHPQGSVETLRRVPLLRTVPSGLPPTRHHIPSGPPRPRSLSALCLSSRPALPVH